MSLVDETEEKRRKVGALLYIAVDQFEKSWKDEDSFHSMMKTLKELQYQANLLDFCIRRDKKVLAKTQERG